MGIALSATAREIRREWKRGATWVDAHMDGARRGRAVVKVDSSLGFDELRHPLRGDSPLPPTTIVVEVA